jgi:DinB superfamily
MGRGDSKNVQPRCLTMRLCSRCARSACRMTRRDDLPTELQKLLDEVTACEREAADIVDDMSDADVNWQQQPGQSWSVAQCLDHLSTMNPYYLRGFSTRLQEATRNPPGPFKGLSPTATGRWFIRTLEPPVRRKMKSPKVAVPRSNMPREGLVDAFVRSHDSYRAMLNAAARVDVNRVTGPNPFLKFVTMRVSTVLLIIPAHDRRHLWQAQNVKRTLRAR